MTTRTVVTILKAIAAKYPDELVAAQLADVKRIAFHIGLVLPRKGTDITVCDVGGGVGLFSVGCAALGMKAILVDDFRDDVNRQWGDALLDIHRSYGVEVLVRNVIDEGMEFPPGSIDVMTCFDSMEHWHHSPKQLFVSMMQALREGGLVVLATPNCVNLRKRITVPLGRGKWSAMKDWYEKQRFRGHVREPDVDDLRYVANDLGLAQVEVLGRNWAGYNSQSKAVRALTMLTDGLLRLRPQLCSDIYVLGLKT